MRKRFAAIPIAAARVRQLGAVAQVYIALTGYDDKEGHAFPSVASIVDETVLHRRTVQRAINALCEAGLINRQLRNERAGDSDTSLYTVLQEVAEGAADTPPPRGERSATGAADVTAPGAAQRAAQTNHLTDHLTQARA